MSKGGSTEQSFSEKAMSTSGQRRSARALSQCLAVDVMSLINPAVGAAGDLKAATATVASIVTLTAADLLTAGKTKLALHGARAITFTTAGATEADAPANVAITGTDVKGDTITETLALAQTAAAVTSVRAYATITTLVYPAADGTSATIAIGISDKFGFPSKPKVYGATPNIIAELEDGAIPTAGAFVIPATSGPYGAYTPNSSPNGALDFLVTFQLDVESK